MERLIKPTRSSFKKYTSCTHGPSLLSIERFSKVLWLFWDWPPPVEELLGWLLWGIAIEEEKAFSRWIDVIRSGQLSGTWPIVASMPHIEGDRVVAFMEREGSPDAPAGFSSPSGWTRADGCTYQWLQSTSGSSVHYFQGRSAENWNPAPPASGPVTDVSLAGCARRPMWAFLSLCAWGRGIMTILHRDYFFFCEGIVLWSPEVTFAVSVLHMLLFIFVLHQIFFFPFCQVRQSAELLLSSTRYIDRWPALVSLYPALDASPHS